MIRNLIDPSTRESVEVLRGGCSFTSPCPVEFREILALDALPLDAHARHQGLISTGGGRDRSATDEHADLDQDEDVFFSASDEESPTGASSKKAVKHHGSP